MQKEEIRNQLLAKLREELDYLRNLQENARREATHEESRPENEHDTRAVEASYLAAGQAKKYVELERSAAIVKDIRLRDCTEADPIALGSLIELSSGAETMRLLLLPVCGGYSLETNAGKVQIISPESLLGRELLDKFIGDEIIIQTRGRKSYEITANR